FNSYTMILIFIIFRSQHFLTFESRDSCLGLLLRDFTCSSDSLPNTHQCLLIFHYLQIMRCTASNDEMDSIAANIYCGTHGWYRLYLHSNYPAPLLFITRTSLLSCSNTCNYPTLTTVLQA